MTTYAIGDIQGCYSALQYLLEKIQFEPEQDTLWFTGDLINRGPESLQTLRFVKSLGDKHCSVLGNHDLHTLAVGYGLRKKAKGDTLDAILQAPDREELMNWLRHRPLLHHDAKLGYTIVHAGIAPNWSLTKALGLAKEVETVLRGDGMQDFLNQMYGNQPDRWQDNLTGWDRLRCITNHFTRMRFCYPDGRIELSYKGTLESPPNGLKAWFQMPHRANQELKIIFGHWAALAGATHTPRVYALDTGCVWGYALTAMRLEDEKRVSISCHSF